MLSNLKWCGFSKSYPGAPPVNGRIFQPAVGATFQPYAIVYPRASQSTYIQDPQQGWCWDPAELGTFQVRNACGDTLEFAKSLYCRDYLTNYVEGISSVCDLQAQYLMVFPEGVSRAQNAAEAFSDATVGSGGPAASIAVLVALAVALVALSRVGP